MSTIVPGAPQASSTAARTSSSAQPAASTAPKQIDYMKLIVAQMTNLNPMDSKSGSDGMPLMLQAESLNQLNQLATGLSSLQNLTQASFGASLLGRTVSGIDANGAPVSGAVTALKLSGTEYQLELEGGKTLRVADVVSVGK